MPELPDIQVFANNIQKHYGGKVLTKLKVVNGQKLKDSTRALSKAVDGSKLKDVFRSGKVLRFQFANGTLIGLHLMLTGDLIPFEKKNERKSTIVEFHFKDGTGLALTDRMKNANVRLNPEDKAGIDALDSKLNFAYLKKIFNRKAQIKNLLPDQNLIRGLGNSYSDEILWQTGISPFSVASAIPDAKIKELARVIKSRLKKEIRQITKAYPDLIHGEVKEFLLIHTKQRDVSPTGGKIKIASRGMLKTYYTDEQRKYE